MAIELGPIETVHRIGRVELTRRKVTDTCRDDHEWHFQLSVVESARLGCFADHCLTSEQINLAGCSWRRLLLPWLQETLWTMRERLSTAAAGSVDGDRVEAGAGHE
jgi:hypothetical protein